MREIRPLIREEIPAFMDIVSFSYPDMDAWSRRDFYIQIMEGLFDNPETSVLWGVFDNDRMVGCCVMYDYTMNYHGAFVPTTGIGMVATALASKKEHIARDLLSRFLVETRKKGAVFATLYPFRPDFYRKMGFGFGNKVAVYSWKPAQFPVRPNVDKAGMLTLEDQAKVAECYNRIARKTHGMYLREDIHWKRYLRTPGVFYIGCRKKGRITGYACCHFVTGKQMSEQILDIREMLWEDTEAMYSLFGFISTQADQVGSVKFAAQDPDLVFLTEDPRHQPNESIPPLHHKTDAAGIGFMYRAVDTHLAVLSHPWPEIDLTVRFEVDDDFLPANQGGFTVRFIAGKPEIITPKKADVTLKIAVAHYSSLLTGAITLEKLMAYALCEVTGKSERLLPLFATQPKPICWSIF
jgi:predicted acetyltransferase